MRVARDLDISAVIPLVVGHAIMVDETRAARDQSAESLQRMFAAAQADVSLRADVAFGDTGPLLIRLNRPLPGRSRALDQAIAHRHLDLVLAGLRADGTKPAPLRGPGLTLGAQVTKGP
jgi:hypothetical protein